MPQRNQQSPRTKPVTGSRGPCPHLASPLLGFLGPLPSSSGGEGPFTPGYPAGQPGVSKHLRVLREAGLVEVRANAQRRVYRLRTEPLREIDEWLAPYRAAWAGRLGALGTGGCSPSPAGWRTRARRSGGP
jgi:hypothetical protein